jgi:hypothetical protein
LACKHRSGAEEKREAGADLKYYLKGFHALTVSEARLNDAHLGE